MIMKTKAILFLLMVSLLLMGTGASLAEEAAYTYTEEDILIDAPGGYKIPATLTLPVGGEGETFRAIVMLHGYGSNRHEAGNAYDAAAPRLAQAGIASLRFDYLGMGDSEGDYVDFTKDVGVEEAMACHAYLAALDTVDEGRIGIMGWSMGGLITLQTAARNDVFSAVLTWAGATGMDVSDEDYEAAKRDGYVTAEFDWREPLKIGFASMELDRNTDTLAEVANIKAPILAINGLLDDVVPPSSAQEIVDAAGNASSMVLLMKDVDHTFNVFTGDMTALENVTNMTIAWFLDMM